MVREAALLALQALAPSADETLIAQLLPRIYYYHLALTSSAAESSAAWCRWYVPALSVLRLQVCAVAVSVREVQPVIAAGYVGIVRGVALPLTSQ